MNIIQLLTYNIKEHNRVWTTHQGKNWPTFWRSLGRRYHRALRWNNIVTLWQYLWHPFYKDIEALKPILFVTISNNNDRALAPMWERLDKNSYSIIDQRNHNREIPVALVLFYSLLYMWPLLICYFNATKFEKSIMEEYFDEYFCTIGYMVVIEKLLKHNEEQLIVMANDHESFNRAFVRVANELGIKTMYTQHCSVTEAFPPLEFTYSFLDGEESLIKYLAHDKPKKQVCLAGNPRFDVIGKYRTKTRERSYVNGEMGIGIALNQLDDETRIKQLCLSLHERGFKHIVVRPHPSMDFNPTWYIKNGYGYSDSKKENPFEFIAKLDVIVAGECGIHLDTAMMGVRSICYNMTTEQPLDWYSYIKNGLCPYADNIDELLMLLTGEKVDADVKIQSKARWYNAAYGMPAEGHVGEMMADFIRYEQAHDVVGFDMKYGFVEKEVHGVKCKVYKE